MSEPAVVNSKKPIRAPVSYHCDNCRKDITTVPRIKCAECVDFDLCVECFTSGVEIGTHKSNHAYQVMDRINFPLFAENWGADEELLLLEAIEMYGFGNWSDVADHVGTKFNWECKDHYFATYLDCPTSPLPDLTLSFPHAVRVETRSAPPPPIRTVKEQTQPGMLASMPILYEHSGFMPLREEFETEWDNDAEEVLGDMAFLDTDTPQERETKLKLVRIYNKKLEERDRKRKFVIDYQLYDPKKAQLWERRRHIEEKDLYRKTKMFVQVCKRSMLDELLKGLLEEKSLRKKIRHLQTLRLKGSRTLAEAHYQSHFKPENERGRLKRKSESSILQSIQQERKTKHRKEELDIEKEKEKEREKDKEKKKDKDNKEKDKEKSNSSKLNTPSLDSESGVSKKTDSPTLNNSLDNTNDKDKTDMDKDKDMDIDKDKDNTSNNTREKEKEKKKEKEKGKEKEKAKEKDKESEKEKENSPPSILERISEEALTLSGLLSNKEQQFCQTLQFLPSHYLALKKLLIFHCTSEGSISKTDIRYLVDYDTNKVKKLFDFLKNNGWVNTLPPVPSVSNSLEEKKENNNPDKLSSDSL